MRIVEIKTNTDYTLNILDEDGRQGIFDVNPYFKYEAFVELKNQDAFKKIMNGGYFIEWDCGADLSADTIERHMVII